MRRHDLKALQAALAIRALQQQSAQLQLAHAQTAKTHAENLHADALAIRDEQECTWKAALSPGGFSVDIARAHAQAILKSDAECAWFDRRVQEAGRLYTDRTDELQLANAQFEACDQIVTVAHKKAQRAAEVHALDAVLDQTVARACHAR